ncbi:hypothetical protein GCM10009830_01440 [Glycomyces endophyticus]|uniref:Type I-E CRISPR-associated protein Cse2/CasB n=1 Tax=Glycomyces endophyticus TaxID=480996 RepID=A0ABP4RR43_9ACTN
MVDPPSTPSPPIRRPLRTRTVSEFGRHVSGVVGRLQAGYLEKRPNSISSLARLRNSVNFAPGAAKSAEAIWLPSELLGAEYVRPDEPSHTETALHTAVTLFAVHQQSQAERMHRSGVTFAAAVQRLALGSSNEDTVHRRFAAIGSAVDYSELVYHARGLVTQLRGEKIGFDYGLFADDLCTFQSRTSPASGLSGAEYVRALWGREYWRARPKPNGSDDPDTAETADADDAYNDEQE